MTTDEIRELKPDRETDMKTALALGWTRQPIPPVELAAVKSFGGEPRPGPWFSRPGHPPEYAILKVPEFTADTPEGWAASRECWEWLLCRGWYPLISTTVFPGKIYVVGSHTEHTTVVAVGDSLPHALALLVLLVAHAEGLL